MNCAFCGRPLGLRNSSPGFRTKWGMAFCRKIEAVPDCIELYENSNPPRWWYRYRYGIAFAVLLALVALAGYARAEEPWKDAPPAVKKWFNDQMTPDGQSGCCSTADAVAVDVLKNADSTWSYYWNGAWLPIPESKLEFVDDTPYGKNYVFQTKDGHVYCAKLLRPRI